MPKALAIDTADHIDRLREVAPAGSTLYTILRHVSRSGMQRRISVVAIESADKYAQDAGHGEPMISDLSASTARVLDRRLNRDDFGIVCNGAGMDMGFELVYSLARKLYGDGYALKQRWI